MIMGNNTQQNIRIFTDNLRYNQNNITEMIMLNRTRMQTNCSQNKYSEQNIIFEFWIDGVAITVRASIGFVENCIAIFILMSKENMRNMFNHLVTCSLMADNL